MVLAPMPRGRSGCLHRTPVILQSKIKLNPAGLGAELVASKTWCKVAEQNCGRKCKSDKAGIPKGIVRQGRSLRSAGFIAVAGPPKPLEGQEWREQVVRDKRKLAACRGVSWRE